MSVDLDTAAKLGWVSDRYWLSLSIFQVGGKTYLWPTKTQSGGLPADYLFSQCCQRAGAPAPPIRAEIRVVNEGRNAPVAPVVRARLGCITMQASDKNEAGAMWRAFKNATVQYAGLEFVRVEVQDVLFEVSRSDVDGLLNALTRTFGTVVVSE